MIDVNTVIGDPVETQDGTIIVPVSRVAFGFAAGGSEFEPTGAKVGEESDHPFGGGSGAGVSVQPVGFLVVAKDQIRMLPVDGGQPINRIIDMAPQLFDKLKGTKPKPVQPMESPGPCPPSGSGTSPTPTT